MFGASTAGKQQGFTLVELLVAMLVFSLLSGFAYRSVNELSRVSIALSEEERQFKFVQQGLSIIERDLRRSTSLVMAEDDGSTIFDSDGQLPPLFKIGVIDVRPDVRFVEYHFADGTLQRNVSAEGEKDNDGLRLMDSLENIEAKLLQDGNGVAMGMELLLAHKQLGQIARLIRLPANDLKNMPSLAKLNTLEFDVLASTGSGVGGGSGEQAQQPAVVRPSGPVKAENVAIW